MKLLSLLAKVGFMFGILISKSAAGSSFGQQSKVAGTNEDEVNTRSKRFIGCPSYFMNQKPQYPRDCSEVYDFCEYEISQSGIFAIQPEGALEPFEVYCNNSIDGGGWTVFQRRVDGAVDFFRNWNEYKHGFGFLQQEFWLGNDKLAYLTNQKSYQLRVDLNDVDGNSYYAKYNLFRISDEWSNYRLVDLGEYLAESTGYDAMARHRNKSFSTYDHDNDGYSYHCAFKYHGAWWYADCYDVNLNGGYFSCEECWEGITWKRSSSGGWFKNIKYTELKLRPL